MTAVGLTDEAGKARGALSDPFGSSFAGKREAGDR